MPSPAAVEAFVAQVLTNDHVGAIRDWYAPGATMQENQAPPRVGRDTLMQQEAAMLARSDSVLTELLDPPMVAGDRVAIHWRFTFVMKNGHRFAQEEIAWQRWDGDKIAEEQFFYDPAQRSG
jgi:ketosteroid isomerase-like protein